MISDAEFRLLADNLPTLCWMANGDGYIVWYNRRWHEYCGTTPEQMEGWGWQSVHDPELLPDVMERWTASIATGEPFEMTFPLRGADDVFRPFLTRIQPVRGESGQVIRWFGVNIDVSAELQAEAALRVERDRTRRALDSISEGFVLLDHDFRVVQINAEGLRLEKRPASEIIGKTHWEAWPGTEASELGRLYKQAMAERVPVRLEHCYEWAAGHQAWLDMRAYPTADGLTILYRNISEQKLAEQALRASEAEARESAALLEAIGASSPSLIYAKDRDCRTIYANSASLSVFGRTREEVVGRTSAEIAGNSAEGQAHLENDRRVMRTGEIEAMDEVFTTADGVTRTYRSVKAPLRSSGGEIVGVVGVSTDVTDRLLVENELRESRGRLDLAVSAHGVGIFDWFVQTGRVVWSAEEERIFGLEPGTFEGDISGWAKRLVPDDLERLNAQMSAAMTRGDKRLDFTFRAIRADGEIRFIEGSSRFLYAEDGTPERMVGTNMDVTERVLSADRLRESEARLRAVVEQMPIGVIIARIPTGELLIYNRACEAIMGHPMLGATAAEYGTYGAVHGDDRPYAAEDYPMARAVLLGETVRNEEVRYRRPDGRVVHLSVSAARIIGPSGEPDLAVCTFDDVSEGKRHELHQRLLIDELNHRARNLLAIVQGVAQQTLKGPDIPAGVKQAFEGRLGALAAAHGLLANRNWGAAPINQVVTGTVAAIVPAKGRVDAAGNEVLLPPKTAVSLAMAVHELATNAVKYGALSVPDGSVEVRWRVENGRLKFVWLERGGPAVTVPERRGFGTRMVERALAAELGGEVKIEFRPQGVVCRIEAPAPDGVK